LIITLHVFNGILSPSFLELADQIACILYNFVENHLYAT
jgi:hypothetical protein